MNEHGRHELNRRVFLTGMAFSAAAAILPPGLAADQPSLPSKVGARTKKVAEVFLDIDKIHKWDASMGDTWDPFWADDGNLYAFNCDGRGFGPKAMNLAFNRLSGDSPSSLTGTQVNEMDEYGVSSKKGPDNATWKACGQECIDNVFYAFVSRNVYGSDSNDPELRQLAINSSLIKSTDRGLTWKRSAQENYDRPMWPGSRFGAPFFIHYGRNGGQISVDSANEYVYAASTNGFWNDGDSLVLGRVKRSSLPNLNSLDWEYCTGRNGAAGANWSRQIEAAVPILDRPVKCGQTPICFVPDLGIYLLISWYNTRTMTKWYEPNEMRYDFYQALHPWGPWEPITSISDRFMNSNWHMYGPSLCAKFQKKIGQDVMISLFTSGCPFEDVPFSPYKMWHIPVLLRTSPLPKAQVVAAADKRIVYHGSWLPLKAIDGADANAVPIGTQDKEGTADLTFSGTGIEYVARKTAGQGSVEIYIDGVRQGTADLDLQNFPSFSGVVVFSRLDLKAGEHAIRIVNASSKSVNVESFKVYA